MFSAAFVPRSAAVKADCDSAQTLTVNNAVSARHPVFFQGVNFTMVQTDGSPSMVSSSHAVLNYLSTKGEDETSLNHSPSNEMHFLQLQVKISHDHLYVAASFIVDCWNGNFSVN